jgi:transcriptional regulator with XRE-family HTH domain
MITQNICGIHVRHKFSQLIRDEMAQENLSIVQLASDVGCSPEHIRKIANGETFPSKHLQRLIVDRLKLDSEKLEKQIQEDRWIAKYGKLPPKPVVSPVFAAWDRLTAAQRSTIICIAECMLKRKLSL